MDKKSLDGSARVVVVVSSGWCWSGAAVVAATADAVENSAWVSTWGGVAAVVDGRAVAVGVVVAVLSSSTVGCSFVFAANRLCCCSNQENEGAAGADALPVAAAATAADCSALLVAVVPLVVLVLVLVPVAGAGAGALDFSAASAAS